MMLSGFSVTDEIYAEKGIGLYHAFQSKKKSNKVILKAITNEYPSPLEVARLEQEYLLIKKIQFIAGIPKPLKFVKNHNKVVMLFEDSGETTLKHFLNTTELSITNFLDIAISLAKILAELHDHRVIHKDIKPTNILINPKTLEIKIINFECASLLTHEVYASINPKQLEGTLAYMSPEQTGRMGRPIDYRSDFYSLGVTFFEMLTGRLPFRSKDPISIIHSHIAKKPPLLRETNPEIPQVIEEIILKLMAKSAEDRYQSAFGLISDLKQCKKEYEDKGKIEIFPLGKLDISSSLQISQKLYGREQEIKLLNEKFKHVLKGESCAFLVTGPAGIGKSIFIQEAHKSLIAARGMYSEGRFAQLKQAPNNEWTQALGGLLRQILIKDEQTINRFKNLFKTALGDEGQLIVDIIPELELFIGKQPTIPKLLPADTKNRFYAVFKRFLQVFADKSHPLVIFIDNLQWAGAESLELLAKLVTEFNLKYCFIIIAYRDNKIKSKHLMKMALDKIKEKITTTTVKLRPLTEQDITQLLVDSFHSNYQKAVPLAKVCYEKTSGNPFFLNQFIQMLYTENLIYYSSESGKWEWDLIRIQKESSTQNVVDLMIHRIQMLPDDTQKLLQLSACIGDKFNLDLLADITRMDPNTVIEKIWPALQKCYIKPLDESYKFLKSMKGLTIKFKFLHDRVQQAAYLMLPDAERKKAHFCIGKALLKRIPKEQYKNRIFTIVNHLNRALSLFKNSVIKEKIASLNLLAALKAKETTAYQFAFAFAQNGLNILKDDTWEKNYDLILDLNKEAAESAYLIGDYKNAEYFSDIIVGKTTSLLDKASTYEVKISTFLLKGRPDLAVDFGLSVLKEFNISVPRKPKKRDFLLGIIHLKLLLAGKDIRKLVELPPMKDPYKLAAISLLFKVSVSAFYLEPELFALIGLKMATLSIKYGNSELSSVAYCSCVLIFTLLNDLETADEFSKLSFDLADKYNTQVEKSLISLLVGSVFYPRKYNLNKACTLLWETFQNSVESTYLEFAWNALEGYFVYSFLAGKNIGTLLETMKNYNAYAADHNIQTHKILFDYLIGFFTRYRSGNCCLLTDKDIYLNQDKALKHLNKVKNKVSMTGIRINNIGYYYCYGNYEAALQEASLVEIKNLKVIYSRSNFHMMTPLAQLALFERYTKIQQQKILRDIPPHLKLLKKWARNGPENFLNKYYLVKAEVARVTNNEQAAKLYNLSIQYAKKNGYVQEEGLANELAGKYYLGLGWTQLAKVFLSDAYYCYRQWGALGKLEQLKTDYPEYLSTEIFQTSSDEISTSSSITNISTAQISNALDFETILKATYVISSEVVLKNLVSKVLNILSENTGADECALLLMKNQQLFIEGRYIEGSKQKNVLRSEPLTSWEQLPISIIDYVRRTKQSLVLNDTRTSEFYNNDPYIISHLPKSILCIPIISHNNMLGILYFENKSTANAFTAERLKVLAPLASQVAISIENASLYQAIERFVPKEFLTLLERRNLIEIQLGDAVQKFLSILFIDIKGFTTLSERLAPVDVFEFINSYLRHVEPVITEHNGFIDKYLGDGIMAIFPQNPDDALKAALGMHQALIHYNKTVVHQIGQEISARIGINTGAVMLGTVGTMHRIDSSVISDAVNTAARIMDLNRVYGTNVLIGEETFNSLKDNKSFILRRIDRVLLRGKDVPITIWEVFTNNEKPISKKMIEKFESAVSHYQDGKFEEAKKLFEEFLIKHPNDNPSKVFIERCQYYIDKGRPKDWKGVTRF